MVGVSILTKHDDSFIQFPRNYALISVVAYQKTAQPNAVFMVIATKMKTVSVMQDGQVQIVIFKPVLLSV